MGHVLLNKNVPLISTSSNWDLGDFFFIVVPVVACVVGLISCIQLLLKTTKACEYLTFGCNAMRRMDKNTLPFTYPFIDAVAWGLGVMCSLKTV